MEERYFGILQTVGAITSIAVLSLTATLVKRISVAALGAVAYGLMRLGGCWQVLLNTTGFFV